ncbi:hypothetical protein [Acidipropionibacterium virtanenii]|uniref:Uncharacterized protein n=1 Tax=Acidipropionibacterium virtanenii TaxID=2057246 RepID=A0A344UWD7_9ACTN|nr:hypothetical protein [Acidipropionibacterium virtanenii]AXE39585.1 hypothetical protein JS278_02447 [Acidipropionibacterium virtanenii]
MISFDLHSLGFDAASLDELVSAAVTAGAAGAQNVDGFELLAAYTDPSGARLGLIQSGGELDTIASLVCPTTHPAEVFRYSDTLAQVDVMAPGGSGSGRGGGLSRAGIGEAGVISGDSILSGLAVGHRRERLARFLANVDDPVEYPLGGEPGEETPKEIEHLRVGAVPTEFPKIYDSEEAYGRSEEGSMGTELSFSAGALISPWLLEISAGRATREQASAAAQMTMVVQRVERRTNRLTGVDWLRVIGTTSIPMTLALPADLPHAPHEGSVISATVTPVVSSGTWEAGQLWG